MAILTRVTGKVFGQNAPLSECGVFGSAKAGSGVNTTDVATIQSGVAYLQGWGSGIVSAQNFPPMEEVTGVLKTISYQACYSLQTGVPIYDANTEYGKGDIVKVTNGVQLEFYVSVKDATVAPDYTPNINKWGDTNFWQKALIIGEREIGVPQITLNPNSLPTNCVWLEGQLDENGDYPNLKTIYGTTYNHNDDPAGSFRLPDFREKYICGVGIGSETTMGYVNAGIPNLGYTAELNGSHTHARGTLNIIGQLGIRTCRNSGSSAIGTINNGTGAFTASQATGPSTSSSISYNGTNSNVDTLDFNAVDGWRGSLAQSGSHTHTVSSTSPLIDNNLSTIKVDGIKVRVYTRYK